MKTAISLPDTLYEEAEKTAKSMGIPRSQLYAKAIEEYISHYSIEGITEKYNEVYSRILPDGPTLNDSVAIENLRELTKNDSW